MQKSKLIELLKVIEGEYPVVIYCPVDDSIRPLSKVYHEPPRTFLQSEGEKNYSNISLLKKIEKLSEEVPFNAYVVSGDDWNYQNIEDISIKDKALIVSLSQPIFD